MPYTPPTTRATSDLITASIWNTDLVDNISFLANPPSCRVYRNTTQLISSTSVGVPVSFSTERWDTNNLWTSGSPTRITFGTAGLYLITAHSTFDIAADYQLIEVSIRLNGGTNLGGHLRVDAALSHYPVSTVTSVHKATAGDYVEMIVAQTNAAAAGRNLFAGSATNRHCSDFSATWIGIG